MKSIKNLVTGGAGFLGSHLIDSLMESDEEVVCLDNFLNGKKNNINKWINHPKFKLIQHDIKNNLEIDVSKIWHLACPASPSYYQSNPIETLKTSFLGTLNMLELAKKLDAKLLFASSSEIYGNPKVHPQPESYWGYVNTTGIRSCYNEGKRIGETLCNDYKRIHDLDIKIIRIFNTYGPKMNHNDERVICNFIYRSLNNKPIIIYGNGLQTRSFCFVDDLIKGMRLLMESNYNKPLNLGNPYEITIKELAQLIKSKTNSKIDFIYKSLPDDDPMKRKPNINAAKDEINWEPTIDLDKGLEITINWFKNLVEN